MKIVPVNSAEMLLPIGRFPHPFDATDEQLESVLYEAENWIEDGKWLTYTDDTRIIVTFDEIRKAFEAWDQSEEDEDSRYDDVHDYLRDCIGNGYHPVELKGDT